MKMPLPYDRSTNDNEIMESKKTKSMSQSSDPYAPGYVPTSWPSSRQENKNKKRYIIIGA